ncbi:MAG: hypothetical protein KDB79_15665 [Acidobacteria bacterium]|nr:hypothetical protein [Acidobacteriota bacterium]
MKFRTKILLGFICVLILSQMPFFISRWKTGKLNSRIAALASDPNRNLTADTGYKNYQGIIHAHSFLGGHSTGTFDELITAAAKNKLDFVVMTEHTSEFFETSESPLNGSKNEILFVGGNEISAKDGNRFLVIEGFPHLASLGKLNTEEFLTEVHRRNSLAVITYPEKFKAWDSKFDGIEIFSLHTNAKKMNPITFFFDMIWSYHAYPELTLARYFVRPDANLAKFDELAKTRTIRLFAGTDAHSNLGFHIGDDANNKFFNVKFDRYETIFKLVRTHILLPADKPLSKENLLEALKAGNSYIGLDVLSDTRGFLFSATNGSETKILGDQISIDKGPIKLKVSAPQIARFVVYKDGEPVFESGQTASTEFDVNARGNYRVEVYLDVLGEPFGKMPWIVSNPIFVK